jgi:hypothetical protein
LILSQKHFVALGLCETCGSKQYLTIRELKKSFVVYLVLEYASGKRQYRKVTDFRKTMLADHHSGKADARDADSLEILTQELRSEANQILKTVTELEKYHSSTKE